MDPRTGPVSLTISGTSAALLARLSQDGDGAGHGNGDAGAVMMRALGLYDLAMKARREGKRLVFIDPATGQTSEVAF